MLPWHYCRSLERQRKWFNNLSYFPMLVRSRKLRRYKKDSQGMRAKSSFRTSLRSSTPLVSMSALYSGGAVTDAALSEARSDVGGEGLESMVALGGRQPGDQYLSSLCVYKLRNFLVPPPLSEGHRRSSERVNLLKMSKRRTYGVSWCTRFLQDSVRNFISSRFSLTEDLRWTCNFSQD
jgi:hypothetical protein